MFFMKSPPPFIIGLPIIGLTMFGSAMFGLPASAGGGVCTGCGCERSAPPTSASMVALVGWS